MRKACSRNIGSILCVLAILTGILSGCAGAQPSSMTLGEWITLLDQKAGISAFSQAEPYFLNVSKESPYFEAVQSAVEWSVLDTGTPFDPEAVLTREWTAYTLMNLSERDVKGESSVKIRDISKSAFPKHVSSAVASGLMPLDDNDRFEPRKAIDRETALACLSAVCAGINHREIQDPHNEITFDDAAVFTDEVPEEINAEEGTASFSEDADIREGQYLTAGDPAHPDAVYRITEVNKTEEGKTAAIEPAAVEEIVESIDAAESFSVDFSTARIVDSMDGMVIQDFAEETAGENGLRLMAKKNEGTTKTHNVNGYQITYSVKPTGVRVLVEKETKGGMMITGDLTVSNVRPSYIWKTENGKIRDGYFRIDFIASENLGADIASYKELYGDFSRVDPQNFLGTVRNLFQEKQNCAEITLPLAKITVPVPNAPVLSVDMQLQLTLRAYGKAQLTLSQDCTVGMEIRDGNMRDISRCDMKAQASIEAKTGILGGVNIAMDLAGMGIADVTTEAGGEAGVSSILHLYDKEGNHTSASTDVPPDILNDLSDGNENVFACADISAYKTIDIKLNSPDTLAGRNGLSTTIVLADEKNGALIPELNGHYENGHKVAKCTRGERIKPKDTGPVVESDQIRIDSYSLIADPGQTKKIKVTALPKGYTVKDLVVTSLDPSVASAKGTSVTAVGEGSTIIRIRTKDNKYEISCSILVRHKE